MEEIGFKVVGSIRDEVIETAESLQRTEEWLEKRKGRFTGSKIKDLMSCGRSTSKMPWGSPEKLVDFGAAAERYIYSVGMERRTGQRSMSTSSKQMQHGTNHEPLLIEKLISDGVISNFEELTSENFGEYQNGGASPDGRCVYGGEVVGLELKCCVSWDGHYNRMYEPVHDKHGDFWQFQAEMLAMGVEKLLYVVTHPMTVESYDKQITTASKVHQEAMLHRCKIADLAISMWGDKLTYRQALEVACAEYKINQ